MSYSKCILAVVFLLQLSTCVLSESNVTEDAEKALILLNNQLMYSGIMVSEHVPGIWNSYYNGINETIREGLLYHIGNFSALLHNLTEFADIANGTDCLSNLDEYLDLNNYIVHVWSEEEAFHNFLSLANTGLDYVIGQTENLAGDFNEYCVKNSTNCEGTSKFIVGEAERLKQIARRIPFDFLAETHLLGYRLEAVWAMYQASFNIDYNKVIQIATTCLSLNFETNKEESFEITNEAPKNVQYIKIYDTYQHLVHIIEATYKVTTNKLLSYSLNVMHLGSAEYDSTIVALRNAIFKTNQTVISLVNFAQDLNITTHCNTPELLSLMSSSLIRGLGEYSGFIEASTISFKERLNYLSTISNEPDTIVFQVRDCSESINCDSVLKKLNRKMTEIPSLLHRKGNAEAVLQHQFIPAIKESGYKIVRDVFDRLESPLVLLKDCVRGYLYDEH